MRTSERVFKRTVPEGTRDNCKRILHKSASLETAGHDRQQVACHVPLFPGRQCNGKNCSWEDGAEPANLPSVHPTWPSHALYHLIRMHAINSLDDRLYKAGESIYCPAPAPAQLSKCVFRIKDQAQRAISLNKHSRVKAGPHLPYPPTLLHHFCSVVL